MNRISSLAIVPFLAALGACSSSSPSGSSQQPAQPPPGSSGGVASDDGGAGDDAAPGDDGSAANAATEYDAVLTGAQIMPTPVLTTSSGTGKFLLQPDGVTLTYDITLTVPGATAVNLHMGPPAENAGVTHQLMPVSGHMTGSVMLSTDEQNAVGLDGMYLDVQSMAYPNGEVRGQLVPPGSVVYLAMASGSQEVPPVQSTYEAHGSFILSADQTTVRYHVATTAVPTDVHLRRAIASLQGPVAYPLTPIAQSLDGTITLGATGTDVTDLQNGHFFLNVVTAANPDGELRGQILAPGQTLFAGALSGTNEVPPTGSTASGGVQFILSPDQTRMHYEAVVTGIIPTSAEVDNAVAGMTGPMIFPLMLNQMQVLGDATMAAGDLTKFMGGAAYVNVHTASYATGEVRAQLVRP